RRSNFAGFDVGEGGRSFQTLPLTFDSPRRVFFLLFHPDDLLLTLLGTRYAIKSGWLNPPLNDRSRHRPGAGADYAIYQRGSRRCRGPPPPPPLPPRGPPRKDRPLSDLGRASLTLRARPF